MEAAFNQFILIKSMSEHGAALQTFNQELVKCVEHLKVKREECLVIIDKLELDKRVLEEDLRRLQDRLCATNNTLQQYKSLHDNYNRVIMDTESGFRKILESSQTLLNLAQHETSKLETLANANSISESCNLQKIEY